jgi:hypothetical protein
MDHILARRLVLFTQVMAALWVVSVIGLLQRLDSRSFQSDLNSLNLLETM